VPVLLGLFLMVWVFSVERFIVIGRASGTGNVGNFVRKIQSLINGGNIDSAISECDKQKGSVANVVKADRKSTRLNSSHVKISYAVFCLKKKYYKLKSI